MDKQVNRKAESSLQNVIDYLIRLDHVKKRVLLLMLCTSFVRFNTVCLLLYTYLVCKVTTYSQENVVNIYYPWY